MLEWQENIPGRIRMTEDFVLELIYASKLFMIIIACK